MDIEVKKEKSLPESKYPCRCGQRVTRVVTIGEVQNYFGTEYDICDSDDCLANAENDYVEELEYGRRYRRELMQQERFDHRYGK